MQEKIKIEGFIASNWCPYTKKANYHFVTCDMTSQGWTMICPYELEFELPEGHSEVACAVAGLRVQQNSVRAKFQEENQLFESQISDLLCLTNESKPE